MSNVKPASSAFAQGVLFKFGVALIFVVMLAITTAAPLAQGLRYVSAICLLISLSLFGLAVIRRRHLMILSEWSEGLIFSLIAACSHLLIGFLN
jgi:hypothetical protein